VTPARETACERETPKRRGLPRHAAPAHIIHGHPDPSGNRLYHALADAQAEEVAAVAG